MNLAVIGFRNRAVILLIVATLSLYGAVCYVTLPAQEDPSVPIRETIVTTSHPGMSAAQVDGLITRPLSEAFLLIKDVEEVRATSSDGRSIIYVKAYDRIRKLDRVWDEVEEAAAQMQGGLPPGTTRPIVNDDFSDVAIITLALTGGDYALSELEDYALHAKEQLFAVQGTRKVEIIGAVEQRIFIDIENAVAARSGISPSAIMAALQTRNAVSLGGQIDAKGRAFRIETTNEFSSPEAIANTLIPHPGTRLPIRLGDVASVRAGYQDPPPQKAFFNGKDAIILAIAMQEGQSAINYARRARTAIDALRANLPAGLALDAVTWQADQVQDAVYGVTFSVLQTLGIVFIVVIAFLGLRTGIIVGTIVPITILATLVVMQVTGIAMERISLATIVISLGLLVDNGVVIADDFKRRLLETGDRDLALRDTGDELAIPLLTSSATTILMFIPLMLAAHPDGEYTRSISLIILTTLTLSWLLAMLVTPTLCHLFLKAPAASKQQADRPADGLETFYGKALAHILRRPALFVIGMFALLPVGIFLIQSVPQKFAPESDRAQVIVYMNLPAGVTTRTTEARMRDMMAIIGNDQRYPDLGDMAAYVGFGGPRFVLSLAPLDPAPHVGFLVVNAQNFQAVEAAIPKLRADFRKMLPDVEARVSTLFLGIADPNVMQIQIKGPDKGYIAAISQDVEAMLRATPGTIDIWSNWYNPITKLDVDVNDIRAQAAGVTAQDVSRSIRVFTDGLEVSRFREEIDSYPIVLRSASGERGDPSRLPSLTVFSSDRRTHVPLAQVADIRYAAALPIIQRENLVPTITIEGRNLLTTPEDLAPSLQRKIDAMNNTLAPGHQIEFDGIVIDAAAAKFELFKNAPMCLGLIVILLVAQFRSFKRPIIVLATIPLTLIGAGIGLVVFHATVSFIGILGIFALVGILINNAIVLIERIDIERAAAHCNAPHNAVNPIIAACMRRLKPILVTTITTVIGLFPLIIAQDPLFYSMASIMAVGLSMGTILSLGVVPALYSLFFRPANKRAS